MLFTRSSLHLRPAKYSRGTCLSARQVFADPLRVAIFIVLPALAPDHSIIQFRQRTISDVTGVTARLTLLPPLKDYWELEMSDLLPQDAVLSMGQKSFASDS